MARAIATFGRWCASTSPSSPARATGRKAARRVMAAARAMRASSKPNPGARPLMSMKPTGNGRRQGYAHVPMPRMTNTYMLAGQRDRAEIIGSVKKGVFAANFGGGQVDITSGKYVFQCTEAYQIENGKLGAPL